jgi:hypothetical protein
MFLGYLIYSRCCSRHQGYSNKQKDKIPHPMDFIFHLGEKNLTGKITIEIKVDFAWKMPTTVCGTYKGTNIKRIAF